MKTRQESEFVEHCPCPECGSSDAGALYTDEHFHCFSCGHTAGAPGSYAAATTDTKNVAIPDGHASALIARGIHQETCEKWGYLVGSHNGRTCQIATYRDDDRRIIAAKLRYPDKSFAFAGEAKNVGLYGKWLWSGGGKMLTITEGEIDALSVSQAQGNKYPVVSVPNGAKAALRAIEKDYEWVCSFDRVNIWFDNDDVGKDAAREVAEALPPGKCHLVKADLKDANEYLKAKRVGDITNLIWKAEPYRPDGIVPGSDITLEMLKAELSRGYDLPYPILDAKLHGLRKRELTLLTAGSGIGKSTLSRELAYHLHQEHGLTIGNVYLEESKEKTAQGYVSIHNNIALGDLRQDPSLLTESQWEASLAEVVHERMFFYDHFGSLDSANLLSKLRYLAVGCHCDFIVLDHISIVISGQESSSEGERRDIDMLMTNLRSLVENTGVGVIAIVHLSQPKGQPHEEGGRVTLSNLRGSGSLKQLSDNVICLERDQQDVKTSDICLVRVLKNREFGEIGEADTLEYNRMTGRLLPQTSFTADCPF